MLMTYFFRSLWLLLLVCLGSIVIGLSWRVFVVDVLPPGNLYDVGGHKLHLDCRGEKNGNPTIIFESGAATPSPVYQHLAENLSKTHKFCMYDRAGLAWSEASGVPSEIPAITDQLHTLLVAANIEKPFVLAGHSIAGLYMKSYIEQYPKDVVAAAFFDASNSGAGVRGGGADASNTYEVVKEPEPAAPAPSEPAATTPPPPPAAEAPAEAEESGGFSLPSVSLPSVSLPSVSLPKLPF